MYVPFREHFCRDFKYKVTGEMMARDKLYRKWKLRKRSENEWRRLHPQEAELPQETDDEHDSEDEKRAELDCTMTHTPSTHMDNVAWPLHIMEIVYCRLERAD